MSPSRNRIRDFRPHEKYYFPAGDLHVLAGHTMFRIHSYFFSRESPIFNRRLYPASPGSEREGTTESNPIMLEEDIKPRDFEKLLWVFYNPRYSLYEGATVDDWRVILNLADKWSFPEVKELAVRELHKTDLDLVSKMALYEKYKVDPKHLVPLYAQLCQRETPLTFEEANIIGLKASHLVAITREKLRSLPSSGGKSPLPEGLELQDVFRAVEEGLDVEVGSTSVTPLTASSSSHSLGELQLDDFSVVFYVDLALSDKAHGHPSANGSKGPRIPLSKMKANGANGTKVK
ncbi:hypothetical protein BJ165DRAFT_1344790 [Panaeolus papilionaceus]|nr:hypothetical protein BJ165DRAFT_1344790 [Panaeolus papilionaceus]